MNSIDQIMSKLADVVGATYLSSAPSDVDAYGGLGPFAVVWPGAPAEVAGVLRVCSELGVAVGVVGFGHRVSRHWPLKGDRPRVALDMRRMTNILDVDETSLIVHCQCGIKVAHLEEALRRHQLTLGHFPREIFESTLGGILAAPPAAAHSPQAGWLINACMGLSVAHADGAAIQTRVAPRSATGPEVARLYLGSHGGLGVITTAVVKVHRLAESELALAFAFPSLAEAISGVRHCLIRGVRPARARVLGSGQSQEELSGKGGPDSEATCVVVLAGPGAFVAEERRLLEEEMLSAGGRELPRSVAQRWADRNTFAAPLPEKKIQRQGVRISYSALSAALEVIPSQIKRSPIHLWMDQFTLQGGTIWLTCAADRARELLATALLDNGLDPLRSSFPPLMEDLRATFDPHETLVVMEG